MSQSSPHPLRILHLASHESLQRGGAVQMIRLARGLAERGHAVTALFNADGEHLSETPAVQRARAAGVRLLGLDLTRPDAPQRLLALWREGGFEVLHCHRESALALASHALTGQRVPCWVAQRGTVYLPGWFSEEHRLLLSPRVHRVVAVAQAVRRALAWRRGVPPWKIAVIYGGVETEIFHPGVDGAPLRAAHGVAPEDRLVTLPGALVEKKGTRFFIEAAARLRPRHPRLRFWIVGRGGKEEAMRQLATARGLDDALKFIGHVDAMPEVYAASDLVVCASIKGEGLTGTLREALAMARPVLTTATAGNVELVEEGVTGYVARAGDAGALAEAIERALADPAEAQRRAAAGRRRVLDWCDESVRSARVEALYRQILARHGRG